MVTLVPLLLCVTALVSTCNASPRTSPDGYHRFAPRTKGFNWTACDANPTRECSGFDVPLDWADHSAGKATLAVARYKATKQPKLGTLFVNPGGPGSSGVDMILDSRGELISVTAGGQYDVVSWDPRGVGLSDPRLECFKTGTEEDIFWKGTIPGSGLEARGNFTDQRGLDEFYEQVDEVDVLLKEYGKRCVEYSPDIFQYVGTAAGVRDMVAMHDVLEGSKKPIDFWGLSYGTVIGIYFVNMFPNRVGRVVLDGVVDPEYWANRPAHEMWWIKTESTDEALTGFVTACATAGPSGCALATKGSTPDSLWQQMRELIDVAYDYKRERGSNAELGSSDVRRMLYDGMYFPQNWPVLAEEVAATIANLHNLTSLPNTTHTRSVRAPVFDRIHQQRSNNGTTNDDPPYSHARTAITCADAANPGSVTTKNVFDFLVKISREVSQMFGPMWYDAGLTCHHWPVRAVERYAGPWNKKLANPILVIGNEADPVTPYISAKKVADALGDSAILIEQDDYGHLSVAMYSNCTTSALRDYFLGNKLPKQDKFCGTDQGLFPGPGITKNTLAKATSYSLASDSDGLQEELDKARARGDALLIAVNVLAAAVGLLFVCLIFSFIRTHRVSKHARATHIPRGAFEKGEYEHGHTYDDPFTEGLHSKSD